MSAQPVHIVDVFATEPYTGNQLAVVENAAGLTTTAMQQLAAEFDFSETTFIETTDPTAASYSVRIFTPEAEVPFAGHPTLGTAWVIRNHLASGTPQTVTLDLPVGAIPVTVEQTDSTESLWMTQQAPTFGETIAPETVAPVLGVAPAAIDPTVPVQTVSTGLPTVIVPLSDRKTLDQLQVDRSAYEEFVAPREAKLLLAVAPAEPTASADLVVRVFAYHYGVPEDPATGSANGCLAGYLARHAYFEPPISVTVRQGEHVGRPSELQLRADPNAQGFGIEVGGQVFSTVRGHLS